VTKCKMGIDYKTRRDLLAYRLMTSLFLLDEVQVETWVSHELKAVWIISEIIN
jgi:hypothetical protein